MIATIWRLPTILIASLVLAICLTAHGTMSEKKRVIIHIPDEVKYIHHLQPKIVYIKEPHHGKGLKETHSVASSGWNFGGINGHPSGRNPLRTLLSSEVHSPVIKHPKWLIPGLNSGSGSFSHSIVPFTGLKSGVVADGNAGGLASSIADIGHSVHLKEPSGLLNGINGGFSESEIRNSFFSPGSLGQESVLGSDNFVDGNIVPLMSDGSFNAQSNVVTESGVQGESSNVNTGGLTTETLQTQPLNGNSNGLGVNTIPIGNLIGNNAGLGSEDGDLVKEENKEIGSSLPSGSLALFVNEWAAERPQSSSNEEENVSHDEQLKNEKNVRPNQSQNGASLAENTERTTQPPLEGTPLRVQVSQVSGSNEVRTRNIPDNSSSTNWVGPNVANPSLNTVSSGWPHNLVNRPPHPGHSQWLPMSLDPDSSVWSPISFESWPQVPGANPGVHLSISHGQQNLIHEIPGSESVPYRTNANNLAGLQPQSHIHISHYPGKQAPAGYYTYDAAAGGGGVRNVGLPVSGQHESSNSGPPNVGTPWVWKGPSEESSPGIPAEIQSPLELNAHANYVNNLQESPYNHNVANVATNALSSHHITNNAVANNYGGSIAQASPIHHGQNGINQQITSHNYANIGPSANYYQPGSGENSLRYNTIVNALNSVSPQGHGSNIYPGSAGIYPATTGKNGHSAIGPSSGINQGINVGRGRFNHMLIDSYHPCYAGTNAGAFRDEKGAYGVISTGIIQQNGNSGVYNPHNQPYIPVGNNLKSHAGESTYSPGNSGETGSIKQPSNGQVSDVNNVEPIIEQTNSHDEQNSNYISHLNHGDNSLANQPIYVPYENPPNNIPNHGSSNTQPTTSGNAENYAQYSTVPNQAGDNVQYSINPHLINNQLSSFALNTAFGTNYGSMSGILSNVAVSQNNQEGDVAYVVPVTFQTGSPLIPSSVPGAPNFGYNTNSGNAHVPFAGRPYLPNATPPNNILTNSYLAPVTNGHISTQHPIGVNNYKAPNNQLISSSHQFPNVGQHGYSNQNQVLASPNYNGIRYNPLINTNFRTEGNKHPINNQFPNKFRENIQGAVNSYGLQITTPNNNFGTLLKYKHNQLNNGNLKDSRAQSTMYGSNGAYRLLSKDHANRNVLKHNGLNSGHGFNAAQSQSSGNFVRFPMNNAGNHGHKGNNNPGPSSANETSSSEQIPSAGNYGSGTQSAGDPSALLGIDINEIIQNSHIYRGILSEHHNQHSGSYSYSSAHTNVKGANAIDYPPTSYFQYNVGQNESPNSEHYKHNAGPQATHGHYNVQKVPSPATYANNIAYNSHVLQNPGQNIPYKSPSPAANGQYTNHAAPVPPQGQNIAHNTPTHAPNGYKTIQNVPRPVVHEQNIAFYEPSLVSHGQHVTSQVPIPGSHGQNVAYYTPTPAAHGQHVTTQVPIPGSHGQHVANRVPSPAIQQPNVVYHAPIPASTGQAYHTPTIATNGQSVVYQDPSPGTHGNNVVYQDPSPGTHGNVVYQDPSPGTHGNNVVYQGPSPGTHGSNVVYQGPSPGTHGSNVVYHVQPQAPVAHSVVSSEPAPPISEQNVGHNAHTNVNQGLSVVPPSYNTNAGRNTAHNIPTFSVQEQNIVYHELKSENEAQSSPLSASANNHLQNSQNSQIFRPSLEIHGTPGFRPSPAHPSNVDNKPLRPQGHRNNPHPQHNLGNVANRIPQNYETPVYRTPSLQGHETVAYRVPQTQNSAAPAYKHIHGTASYRVPPSEAYKHSAYREFLQGNGNTAYTAAPTNYPPTAVQPHPNHGQHPLQTNGNNAQRAPGNVIQAGANYGTHYQQNHGDPALVVHHQQSLATSSRVPPHPGTSNAAVTQNANLNHLASSLRALPPQPTVTSAPNAAAYLNPGRAPSSGLYNTATQTPTYVTHNNAHHKVPFSENHVHHNVQPVATANGRPIYRAPNGGTGNNKPISPPTPYLQHGHPNHHPNPSVHHLNNIVYRDVASSPSNKNVAHNAVSSTNFNWHVTHPVPSGVNHIKHTVNKSVPNNDPTYGGDNKQHGVSIRVTHPNNIASHASSNNRHVINSAFKSIAGISNHASNIVYNTLSSSGHRGSNAVLSPPSAVVSGGNNLGSIHGNGQYGSSIVNNKPHGVNPHNRPSSTYHGGNKPIHGVGPSTFTDHGKVSINANHLGKGVYMLPVKGNFEINGISKSYVGAKALTTTNNGPLRVTLPTDGSIGKSESNDNHWAGSNRVNHRQMIGIRHRHHSDQSNRNGGLRGNIHRSIKTTDEIASGSRKGHTLHAGGGEVIARDYANSALSNGSKVINHARKGAAKERHVKHYAPSSNNSHLRGI